VFRAKPAGILKLAVTSRGSLDDIPDGDLGGTVTVDWTENDLFIFRKKKDRCGRGVVERTKTR